MAEHHVERMKDEFVQLDAKMRKLGEFLETPVCKGLPIVDQQLLHGQFGAMNAYACLLGQRIDRAEAAPIAVIAPGEGMTRYVGTKAVNAKPMTRLDYNILRGWQLPADEDGSDAGYLVEYADGQRPNVDGYQGYVSWSPADVFERAYRAV